MYNLNKDATPESVTGRDVVQVCRSLLVGAAGIGFIEGKLDTIIRFDAEAPRPKEPSGEQLLSYQRCETIARSEAFSDIATGDDVSPNDSEALIALFADGLESVKTWAKAMNRLYNSKKLADLVLDCFHTAYQLGRCSVSMEDILHQLAVGFNATL